LERNAETFVEKENRETTPEIPTYFFSFGHRCTSSGILKNLNLKNESYPFDWIVSNLSTIRHCLFSDFAEFLKPEHYTKIHSSTVNVLDGKILSTCMENPEINRFYYEHSTIDKKIGDKPVTYWLPLALTHHSMLNEENHAYYERCVMRFRERMSAGALEKKRYLHIHPYIGVYEYDRNKHSLIKEWEEFSRFMVGKMGDVKGVFIVPVFMDKGGYCQDIVWEELFRTEGAVGWKVEISNWRFIDSGETFSGEYERELRAVEAMVRREFMEDLPDKGVRADLDSVVLAFHQS
jgi:hypothetical protein